MPTPVSPFVQGVVGGFPTVSSTSVIAKSDDGHLVGVFCASANAGTLSVYNGTGTNGTIMVPDFSLVAGQWYPMPFHFTNGCYLRVQGTASIAASVF